MANTDILFSAIDTYMEARENARSAFLDTKRSCERLKGSEAYSEEMAAAQQKRDEAVNAAQAAARISINKAIAGMQDQIGNIRAEAPTEEQIRVLTVLKMRDHLTRAELDEAAAQMEGNGAGLSVIAELAGKNGISGAQYLVQAKKRLTAEGARALLKVISDGSNSIIRNRTGAKRAAQLYGETRAALYGGVDFDDLPHESRYSNKAEFFESITGVSFDTITKAVDAP